MILLGIFFLQRRGERQRITSFSAIGIVVGVVNFLYKWLWHQSNKKKDRQHIKCVVSPVHLSGVTSVYTLYRN